MNKSETASILKMLMASYPNTKIKEPEVLIDSWMTALGSYPADVVRIAAEFHKSDSAFFPTIAEIKNMIPRAELLKQFEDNNKPKPIDPERDAKTKAELRAIVTDIIDRENGVYVDFLDFER